MKRRSSLCFAVIFLLTVAATAQDRGRVTITVQTKADASGVIGQANGAKIMVVHWIAKQMHPTMMQDQVATADSEGECTLNLLAGVYDLFISANGLEPAAMKIQIEKGDNKPVTVTLGSGSTHLRPVN
jgi:hypothetical protein